MRVPPGVWVPSGVYSAGCISAGGKRKKLASRPRAGKEGQDCLSSYHCCCLPFPLQGGQRTAGPARMAAEQWAQGSLTPSHALGFRVQAWSAGWHAETLN